MKTKKALKALRGYAMGRFAIVDQDAARMGRRLESHQGRLDQIVRSLEAVRVHQREQDTQLNDLYTRMAELERVQGVLFENLDVRLEKLEGPK